MVAATKKKRGRPKRALYAYNLQLRNENNEDRSDRATQNDCHVEAVECLLMENDRYDLYQFFLSAEGRTIRRGILEQLGRMLDAGMFANDDSLFRLIEACIEAYNMGLPCKHIEKCLRAFRLEHKDLLMEGGAKWILSP